MTSTSTGMSSARNFLTKLFPRLVPAQQHTDAAAHGGNVVEHELFERFKLFVRAIRHRGEDFQHLIHVREAAAGGEAIGLVADEEQIQQRFLRQHRAGK